MPSEAVQRPFAVARLLVMMLAVLVLLIPNAQAQSPGADDYDYDTYYPIHARGFVKNAFEQNGIDDINLFNGNLTASIPLGPPLEPGGSLSVQVALHYNAKVWAYDDRCLQGEVPGQTGECEDAGQGALLGARYTGLGWNLSFGHVGISPEGQYVVVTPDGSEHPLFGCRWDDADDCPAIGDSSDNNLPPGFTNRHWDVYTRDGSDLHATFDYEAERVLAEPKGLLDAKTPGEVIVYRSLWTVYFPDGRIAQYGYDDPDKEVYQNVLSSYGSGGVGRDHARLQNGWYCRSIVDPWGSMITIEYERDSFNRRLSNQESLVFYQQLIPTKVTEYRKGDKAGLLWVGSNPTGRTVVFTTERPVTDPSHPGDPLPIMPKRISEVSFEYLDSPFLSYDLDYDSTDRLQIVFDSGYDEATLGEDEYSHLFTDWTYLLTRVSVNGMSGIEYQLRYWKWSDTGGPSYTGYPDAIDLGIAAEDQFTFTDTHSWVNRRQVGTLREITLPTGGKIRYDYGVYEFSYLNPPSIVCTDPQYPDNNPLCGPSVHRSLGVATREVVDGSAVVDRATYDNGSNFMPYVEVRTDLGDPDDVRALFASSTSTTVRRFKVADENGSYDADLGLNTRTDRTTYIFGLRTGADEFTDGEIERGHFRYLPVEGALVEERQYRGESQLLRTILRTYTVDDMGGELPNADGTTEQLLSQDRFLNQRIRAELTYYHDAQSYTVSDTRYESDGWESGCPLVSLGCAYAFSANAVQHRSVDDFITWTGGTPDYSPLDSPGPAFDRTAVTTFDKTPLLDTWLVRLPARKSLVAGADPAATPFSDTVTSYEQINGAYRGVPTQVRRRLSPGSDSSDDVLSRSEYITSTADAGYGKVLVTQIGRAADMGATSWTSRDAESTTYLTYQHGQVSTVRTVCLDTSRCTGWPVDPLLGLRTELQGQRIIDPAWRHATAVLDGNGDGIKVLAYDGIGRLTTIEPTSTMLAETTLSYPTTTETVISLAGLPVGSPAARYLYDGLGRLQQAEQRLPNLTGGTEVYRYKTFRHDGTGQVWQESDWLPQACFGLPGEPTLCSDQAGRVPMTLVPTVDPFGRAERRLASSGTEIYTHYTGAETVETFVTEPGASGQIRSHAVRTSDARGNTTETAEDRIVDGSCDATVAGSCTVVAANIVTSRYNYDIGDRLKLVEVDGPDGTQVRTFTYNPLGFKTDETHPELGPGQIVYQDHTASGVPQTTLYPGNQQLELHLDAAERPVATWATVNGSGPWLTSMTTYGVDASHHLVGKVESTTRYNMLTPPASWTDLVGGQGSGDNVEDSAIAVTTFFDYDHPQGLLTTRSTLVDLVGSSVDDTLQFDQHYSYDQWANRNYLSYPDLSYGGCFPAPSPMIKYSWDPSGLLDVQQLVAIDGGGGLIVEPLLTVAGYDTATAMMTAWSTAAGLTGTVDTIIDHVQTPDGSLSRPSALTASVTTPGDLFSFTGMGYDAIGNLTQVTSNGDTWLLGHDGLSRLVSADLGTPGARAYQYDEYGNMRNRQIGGTWQPISVDGTTNRLNCTGCTYDARGNLVAEPQGGWTRHSRFDFGNHLITTWSSDPVTAPDQYGFVYDASGERVARYRLQNGEVQQATFYLRDEQGNVLTEADWINQGLGTDDGVWQAPKHYVYTGRNAFLRLEPQITAGPYQAQYTSLIHDHLGSTRAEVWDDTTWSTFDYWPYGEMAAQSGLSSETHLFTGHEREYLGTAPNPLQQLDYMHARYYSFGLARFTSVDPMLGKVGSSQSWNRYTYAGSNPVSAIDPLGESSKAKPVKPPKDLTMDHASVPDFDGAANDEENQTQMDGYIVARYEGGQLIVEKVVFPVEKVQSLQGNKTVKEIADDNRFVTVKANDPAKNNEQVWTPGQAQYAYEYQCSLYGGFLANASVIPPNLTNNENTLLTMEAVSDQTAHWYNIFKIAEKIYGNIVYSSPFGPEATFAFETAGIIVEQRISQEKGGDGTITNYDSTSTGVTY